MNPSDHVLLVTDGSSGIGEATATTVTDETIRGGLEAWRPSKPEAIVGGLEANGGEAVAIPTDIGKEQARLMSQTIHDIFSELNILVNKACVGDWKSVAEADHDGWLHKIKVNRLGLMNEPVLRFRVCSIRSQVTSSSPTLEIVEGNNQICQE